MFAICISLAKNVLQTQIVSFYISLAKNVLQTQIVSFYISLAKNVLQTQIVSFYISLAKNVLQTQIVSFNSHRFLPFLQIIIPVLIQVRKLSVNFCTTFSSGSAGFFSVTKCDRTMRIMSGSRRSI